MLKVWMSHGDKVTRLPDGFKLMASTPSCPIAGMADEARGYYGVQFHPEVTHTVQGKALLNRFVLDIAGARPDWVMGNYIEEAVARIREQVGSRGSAARAERRRRFQRRGGADPSRHRRPAHLRLRGPRPPAPERSADGDGHVRGAAQGPGGARRCRATSSSVTWPGSPTRNRSGRSSAASSSRCSSPRRRSSRTCAGWRRARSIPT